MELSDKELDTIREKARLIVVGSIIVEINELEGKLDIVAQDRTRIRARHGSTSCMQSDERVESRR